MAITLEIGLNNKYSHSTSAGQMLASVTLEGVLREPCDVTSPDILVDATGNEQMIMGNANYVKIPAFRRSYWIVRKVMVTDCLIRLHLECDVLATFANAIINTKNFITRASAQWDSFLIDTLQVTSGQVGQATYREKLRYARTISGGVFVLGVVTPSANAYGSITYLVMTQSQLAPLLNLLMARTDSWTAAIEDIPSDISMAIINPLQYIVSCEWFPVAPRATGSYNMQYIGPLKMPTPISCSILLNSYVGNDGDRYSIPIPTHIQYVPNETDYLNTDAYSRYVLRFAPYGEITIPSSMLFMPNDKEITCDTVTDYVTGLSTLTIYSGNGVNGEIAGSVTAKISMSINLSQIINAGMANTFRNITSGSVSGLLTPLADMISDITASVVGTDSDFGKAVSGVADTKTLARNALQVSGISGGGGMGALWVFGEDVQFTNYMTIIPEFLSLERFGRPLGKYMSPTECGKGYIQMLKPALGYGVQGFAGTPHELAKCQQYMQGGFIYE